MGIVVQLSPAADQMDLVLWGLWNSRSRETITEQDWAEAPSSAFRRSQDQGAKIEWETQRMQAVSASIFEGLGLAGGLTGTGILGLLAAWALKNHVTLKDALTRAVGFGSQVEKAETDEDVKKIKAEYRALPENRQLKSALAKVKKTGKVA